MSEKLPNILKTISPLETNQKDNNLLPVLIQEQTKALENQAKAMTLMAEAVQGLSNFLSTGLPQILHGYSKAQSVHSVLNGLVTNAGRGGLDARTHKQNAVDAIHLIETFYAHYSEVLGGKAESAPRPIIDSEAGFEEWAQKNKTETSQS